LYEIVDTYLKENEALERVQAELDAMVELVRRVVMSPPTPSRTEEAIKALQSTVQKLADCIEASEKAPDRPQASYAAVVGAGAGASKRPIILPTPQYKHIPTCHKREIIVVRGTESIPQKMRSYKELVEQLNASWDGTKRGEAGEVVAIRRCPARIW
jgi:hypothetical protein